MEYLFLATSSVVSAIVNAVHGRPREAARSVVVFKLDHLGDLISAAPAISAIRHIHPDAELTLVVGSWCEELARALFPVDIVVAYDSPRFDRAEAGMQAERRALRDVLGGRSFDIAYGLRDDRSSLSFCLWGGAKRRRDRGSVRIRDRAGRLAARLLGRGDPGPRSESDTNLLIAGVSPEASTASGRLEPRPSDVEQVEQDVRRSRAGATGPLIVLHPGAAWVHRRWPVERYAELAAAVREELDAVVFVTGSAGERELADLVVATESPGHVVAGEYGIGEVAALLSLADVFVGADTGITHLASAMGCAVVALFGPGDPRRFTLNGTRDATLYVQQDCSPCGQSECDRDGACMKAIGVADVHAEVLRAVRGGEPDDAETGGGV